MGAEFNFTTKAKNGQELKDWFSDLQNEAGDMYGRGGYSGSWYEAQGIKVRAVCFDELEEAEEWLAEYCQKWEEALAVEVGDLWAVGAWCSS